MSKGNETFDRFKAGDRVKEKIGQGRMQVDTYTASMAARQMKAGREGVVLDVIMRRTGRKPTASMRTYVQVKWDRARTESWHGVNRLEKINMLTEEVSS
jgi:hypothetical protein